MPPVTAAWRDSWLIAAMTKHPHLAHGDAGLAVLLSLFFSLGTLPAIWAAIVTLT